nr:MAG TPA: hypothetical protein [Caudoviricetes sp.]
MLFKSASVSSVKEKSKKVISTCIFNRLPAFNYQRVCHDKRWIFKQIRYLCNSLDKQNTYY